MGHDSDAARVHGGDDARAVGADEAGAGLGAEDGVHAEHVV